MEHYKNLSLENLKEYVEGVGWIEEEWRLIIGYEEFYSVSNFGRVKAFARMVLQPSFKRFVIRRERILKQKNTSDGYLTVTLFKNGERYYTGVHRLVSFAFIKSVEGKKFVNHKDGKKKNNYPYNLEWCTIKENTHHAIRMGLAPSQIGEVNPKAKLKEADVLYIRKVFSSLKKGEKGKLANKYGIKIPALRKAATGFYWKHLNQELCK